MNIARKKKFLESEAEKDIIPVKAKIRGRS